MIETFNDFSFMFNKLKQPLTITKVDTNGVDEDGYPTKSEQSIDVVEPIINSQNPNTSSTNIDGGYYSTTTLYWVSRHGEFDKETKVKTNENEYKVTAKAEVLPKLFYYTIKKVED
ncbi:hypothetical protein MOO46_07560 (plasmid) [Apilactobacillus apisilvae]|uniref:Uncharacterized protein n=1 Tax=Apilactobacillus apisilvae TaxID=2923364 RepID=A0ABY4PIT2_9LACO|nr:hypothetical protein [Apilactobacillus apisilvae]UQS85781.1 hypothetical protein MOO46_07560 [Apilactobacillus apisilvae]